MFTKTCWIALALALYKSEAVAGNPSVLQSAPAANPQTPSWATSTLIRDMDGNIIGNEVNSGTVAPRADDSTTAAGEADAAETPKWAISTIIRDKDGNIIGNEVSSGSGKPTADASTTAAGEADAAETPKWAISTPIYDKDGKMIGAAVTTGTGKPKVVQSTTPAMPAPAPVAKPANATIGISSVVHYPNGTEGYEVTYKRD